ncbi:hypothetical protein FA15DRAFT_689654 [Coprinopsis marcescibilis]|uniref:Uncharacterized protein n=1 Tax=Coprinopsis marcescibilis TaxID=230819 RepID=A0A5C3KG36_COPMA|nr:hypothetical protein FA15DRAFT_689654 [Coprinopsis marcescibilis]
MADNNGTTPQFSWSDTLNSAFSACTIAPASCFPTCLRRIASDDSLQNQGGGGGTNRAFNPAMPRIPRARHDELQGLLTDPSSDTDAERLSLHSNPGRQNRSRRRRRADPNRKKMTLFGFDLFGRSKPAKQPPPIHLPDEDDVLYHNIGDDSSSASTSGVTGSAYRNKRGNGADTPRAPALTTTTSLATFDSDAAPLSASVIEELSSSTSAAVLIAAAEAEAAEFQRQKTEKEERRRRRQERKAQKEIKERLERERLNLLRLRQQGVLPEDGNGEAFEGFQGSGSAVTSPSMGALLARRATGSRTPLSPASTSTSDSASRTGSRASANQEPFGDFVQVDNATAVAIEAQAEEDEEAADLDGGVYAAKPRRAYHQGSSGSGSRSRASSQPPLPHSSQHPPVPSSATQSSFKSFSEYASSPPPLVPGHPFSDKPKKKKKSRHGTSSSVSRTHSSTASVSQPPSLAAQSPTAAGFPVGVITTEDNAAEFVSPSTIEQGLGFFDADDFPPPSPGLGLGSGGHGKAPVRSERRGDFPIAGFGGGGMGGGRKARDVAKFLANRGDGIEGDGL